MVHFPRPGGKRTIVHHHLRIGFRFKLIHKQNLYSIMECFISVIWNGANALFE